MDQHEGMESYDINEITGVCPHCNNPVEPDSDWEGIENDTDGHIHAVRDFYCTRCQEGFTGVITFSDLSTAPLLDPDEDIEDYWSFLNN